MKQEYRCPICDSDIDIGLYDSFFNKFKGTKEYSCSNNNCPEFVRKIFLSAIIILNEAKNIIKKILKMKGFL